MADDELRWSLSAASSSSSTGDDYYLHGDADPAEEVEVQAIADRVLQEHLHIHEAPPQPPLVFSGQGRLKVETRDEQWGAQWLFGLMALGLLFSFYVTPMVFMPLQPHHVDLMGLCWVIFFLPIAVVCGAVIALIAAILTFPIWGWYAIPNLIIRLVRRSRTAS